MVTESFTPESAADLLAFLAALEASTAPAPAPRYTVGQRLEGTTWPRLNKRCTLAEYREQDYSERSIQLCQVEKVLVLSRAEWAELAESLMHDDPRLGHGGHDSDADLPATWEYHTGTEQERAAWRAQSYCLVTVVTVAGATDDADTFLVDAQVHTYARYVGFLAGAPVGPKVERPQLCLVPPPAEVEQAPEVPAWAGVEMTVPDTIRTIEAATVPAAPLNPKARSAGQKERTVMIRKALKDCGVRGVSVTMATGSMCYWTHVRAEGVPHAEGTDWNEHERRECLVCERNQAADKKLHAIIMAAFPDLGDRSDSMTDHFDFVFTVNVNGRR